MQYLREFRDPSLAQKLVREIHALCTRPWKIMEVCGGQTHSIVRFGIDELLPKNIELLHGPGCPVCVTPIEIIDRVIHLAQMPDFIVCTFADMLRVPGTRTDLSHAKAAGGHVHTLQSPIEALNLAAHYPHKKIILFGIGFETTAPSHAVTVLAAHQQQLCNFYLLSSHVLVPPALEYLIDNPYCKIDAFLAAGHVCAIQGLREYEHLIQRFRRPIVATGFEPLDLLQGILMCVRQLESGVALLENEYSRAISRNGNATAQAIVDQVFYRSTQVWRGIGPIPNSGLQLRPEWSEYDAHSQFSTLEFQNCEVTTNSEQSDCISGLVMQGIKKPYQCPQFGRGCTPSRPLGATMVSNEGACAAYFQYRFQVDLQERFDAKL